MMKIKGYEKLSEIRTEQIKGRSKSTLASDDPSGSKTWSDAYKKNNKIVPNKYQELDTSEL